MPRLRSRAPVIVLCACGFACTRTVVVTPPPEVLTPILPGAVLYYDEVAGIQDSVRLVVREGTTWRAIWEQATANQDNPPALPEIDFTNEMTVVVGAGQMKPGDQIRVDSVGVRGGLFNVVVQTIVACGDFPGEAFPVQIVRVARADETPVFQERRTQTACQP